MKLRQSRPTPGPASEQILPSPTWRFRFSEPAPVADQLCVESIGPVQVVVTGRLRMGTITSHVHWVEAAPQLEGSALAARVLALLADDAEIYGRNEAMRRAIERWLTACGEARCFSRLQPGPPSWPEPHAGRVVGDAPRVPENVSQPTFIEARTLGCAVANGCSGKHWRPMTGDLAMLFGVPGETMQVRLNGGTHLKWWGFDETHEGLRLSLQEMGLPAVMLLFVSLGLAVEHATGRATVSLDDLIRAIGVEPRSAHERDEWRRRLWGWLLTFEAMPVIGQRPGKYRDPRTRKLIDLVSVDPLIRVTGTRQPNQRSLDGSEPPLEVSITLGEWAMRYLGDRRILSSFGELRRLAAIPGGKPSGAWARSIGMALQQRWRERSATADVHETGDEQALTIRFRKTFTRRDLLSLYPPEPSADEVLGGKNPARARQYWNDAMALLKEAGVVADHRELGPVTVERQGWSDAWLDQPLEIIPAQADIHAVAEIADGAAAAGARTAKRGRKPRRKEPMCSDERD